MERNKGVLVKFKFSDKATIIDGEQSEEWGGPCCESKEIPRKRVCSNPNLDQGHKSAKIMALRFNFT